MHELRLLETQQQELEKALAGLTKDMHELHVLMSMEGVNVVTGLAILYETGPIRRFAKPSKFRGYAGCAPKQADSGNVKRRGQRRFVNRRLKYALSRVTESLIISKRDNPVKVEYRRQANKGIKTVQAKARARGKTANIVYAMLRDDAPCRFADSGLVARKATRLQALAAA